MFSIRELNMFLGDVLVVIVGMVVMADLERPTRDIEPAGP